jgi:hypothetical protein
MAAKTQVFFHCFTADLFNKVHNFSADTIKLALTNSAPSLSNTQRSDITEIATTGGYTTGGFTLVVSSSAQVSGLARVLIDDYVWTPSATPATWRYAVMLNETSTNDKLICYYDYGSGGITLTNGVPFTFDFDGTLGALRMPYPV